MVANHIVMVEVTSVAPFSVYLIECKAGSPHVQRAATKNAQGAWRQTGVLEYSTEGDLRKAPSSLQHWLTGLIYACDKTIIRELAVLRDVGQHINASEPPSLLYSC